MHLPTLTSLSLAENKVVSYWRLGPQITGGRWYNIYRAAPKTVSADAGFGYVIKLVNPNLPEDKLQLAIDRLGREALATEQIVHPNVIRLLDAELDQAPFFLVQPWIEGRSYDRFLASAKQLSLSRMLWAMRQVAEGIRAGHDQGRVYLGLDPSHIVLGKTGRATLLGWSQSHAISEKTWLPHDQLQSSRYMAPECFEATYHANTASDVYSLGVLMYHSLAMRAPFDGQSIEEVVKNHRHHIPEDLMFIQSACPTELSMLVKQMMAKNPARRPAFREVLNRLISIEIEHLNDMTMIRL